MSEHNKEDSEKNTDQQGTTAVEKALVTHNYVNVENQVIQEEEEEQEQTVVVLSTESQIVEVFRTSLGEGFAESQSDLEVAEPLSLPIPHPQNANVPPTYSSVIRQDVRSTNYNLRRDFHSKEEQHLSPFLERIPPPAYYSTSSSRRDSNSRNFTSNPHSSDPIASGQEPMYVWCTMCAKMIVTMALTKNSVYTHMIVAGLFLFGCWPCCFLPYFLKACKKTTHFCPDFMQILEYYTPF